MLNKIAHKPRDYEWKNYWSTRSISFEFLKALRQIGVGLTKKIYSKVAGLEILPPYLTKANLDSAMEDKKQFDNFIPCLQTVKLELSCSVLEWANKYHHDFESLQKGIYNLLRDPENYWTLNQFGWLFTLSIANKDKLDVSLVKEYISWWIEQLGKSTNDSAWRSYSISERLCNWFNIFQLIGVRSLEPSLIENIWLQIKHLVKHLEKYRNNNTNNHLINNGRALYIIGKFLNLNELSNLGRVILINEGKRQITPDGFLDEGSSHYQLLVTKNYLEILRIAYLTGDKELIEILSPLVTRMLKACAFFIDSDAPEKWQVPYIGDISPDFPPALFSKTMQFWKLVKYAMESKEENFSDIDLSIPWFSTGDNHCYNLPLPPKGWFCYSNSGYYRWTNDFYCVWWHTRKGGASLSIKKAHAFSIRVTRGERISMSSLSPVK